MLSQKDNEILCRVGPGTPMGELMRLYWFPCLPAAEFPIPGAPALRMRLLGEDLVMFRDASGRVAALAEHCPHRGASLYFGRNEGDGLRCVYHGWKFASDGTCLEVTTEPDEFRCEQFRKNVKARSYPCRIMNRMVWIYMGPLEKETGEAPPFPAFEVAFLPESHVIHPIIMMEEANWLQNMEGDLDSAHVFWLHGKLSNGGPTVTRAPPVLDVQKTDYGACYSARRPLPDGREWHRINQFVFPFHTMITADTKVNLRSFVPLDDHHAMLITQTGSTVGPLPPEAIDESIDPFRDAGGYIERTSDPRTYFLTKANKRNDYRRDYAAERDSQFSGVPLVQNLQDRAMTELMTNAAGEPIYDRTREHLSASDAFVIAVRAQLLDAAKRLAADGTAPANATEPAKNAVRAAAIVTAPGADWRAASETARKVAPCQPAVAEVPLTF